MSQEPMYIVRDATGAIYGPAAIGTLRQWIGEGRITAQMEVAAQGTQTFQPAGQMPELLTAFNPVGGLAAGTIAPTQFQSPANQAYGYPNPQSGYYNYPKSSGMAVAAMICGIAGFVTCGTVAIVGIILGHIARGQIRREPERYEGDGMALAGLVLGYICVAMMAVLFIVYVLFIVAAISAAPGGRF
jgi:hypothetical protein